MGIGTSGSGTLSLCDGEAYDLYYYLSGKSYVDFTVYDAAGDVITNYAQFQNLTEDDDPYITFTMDCSVCQWPQNLMASNLTTESAQLDWEQGGDVTSWLVSYREVISDSLTVALNESNWTALPQGWTSLAFDSDDNLVAFEDWTPEDGALVSDTVSYLFLPVTLGGEAVVTARGSEGDNLRVGVYQGTSLVGLNSDNLPYPSAYSNLAESAQSFAVDLSEYQGDGYLFLYHECGNEPANLYLDSLVVYEPYEAEWSEGVVVETTPSYTLTGLTAGTAYQAKVQPVCGANEYGNPRMVSFATPFCAPESQCPIYYELHDSYGDGWNNAYIAVVSGGTEVARLTMENGSSLTGELPLCPGSYQFVWHVGNYDNECYFTIYDPDENVITYKESGTYPVAGPYEPYEHVCRLEVMFTSGWNWWAPTAETNVLELEDLDELESILSQNDGPLSGDLDLVAGQMYKVLVSDDCILSLDGEPFTTASVPLAPGAHWFGFIGSETSVTDVFEDFGPAAGDKVISQDGGFAIYTVVDGVGSWQGTLTTLVPGKGYVYVSQASETKTLYLGQ